MQAKKKEGPFPKKRSLCVQITLKGSGSNGTGDLTVAVTQATGASVHTLGGSVHDSLDALHVGFPRSVGTSVGMGNLDTESNALSAKFALCHDRHLLTTAIYALSKFIIKDSKQYTNRFKIKMQFFFYIFFSFFHFPLAFAVNIRYNVNRINEHLCRTARKRRIKDGSEQETGRTQREQ